MRMLFRIIFAIPMALLFWLIITLIIHQCNIIEWERRWVSR